MIGFLLVCSFVLLFVVESLSRRDDIRHLHFSAELDSTLVEPGEVISLRYCVTNTSRWPVLYASLALRLEPEVELCEDESFCRRYASRDFTGTRIDHHFFLLPHRQFSGRLRFCFRQRGLYELGRYYIESGDFLALHPTMRSAALDTRVLCTAALCPTDELEVRGGELGDISVRRFILDDPTMLLGYREYSGREPMKQISWKQSAKVGRLMVRQNDYTTDRIAAVVVNMDSADKRGMERCMQLTRSVCEDLEDRRIPYALLSNGDLFSLSEGLGRSHLFFILRRVALSRLTGFTPFDDLIEACIRRRRGNCSYIVITPSVNEGTERALARLAPHLDQEILVLTGEEALS